MFENRQSEPSIIEEDSLKHEPIKLQKFMSLCDMHHSIIQQFKYSQQCIHKSTVCIKGCPNAQKTHKFIGHESIPAKQFYIQFNDLRESYFSILTHLRDCTLKDFMARIRKQLDLLEKQLANEIERQGLDLIQKLCRVNQKSAGNVMESMSQKNVAEIELSNLSCKEVFFIKELTPIYKQFLEELKSSETNPGVLYFQNVLQKMLKIKGVLQFDKQQGGVCKRSEKIQIPVIIDVKEISELPQKLLEAIKESEQVCLSQKEGDAPLKIVPEIQTLNLKLSQNISEKLSTIESESVKVLNSSTYLSLLAEMSLKCLQLYLLKVNPSKIYLSLNVALNKELFVVELTKILVKSEVSLGNLFIYTAINNEAQTESYLEKELRLYCEKTKVNVQYGVDWLQKKQREAKLQTEELKEKGQTEAKQESPKQISKSLKQIYDQVAKILKS